MQVISIYFLNALERTKVADIAACILVCSQNLVCADHLYCRRYNGAVYGTCEDPNHTAEETTP